MDPGGRGANREGGNTSEFERFSEQQIIAILKEHEAGMSTTWDLAADLLLLEVEVRRSRCFGCDAPEDAGGREPEAEAASGGAGNGQRDAEGGKKLLTPTVRRSAVRWAIEEKEYSQRRACSLIGLAPKVFRHRSRRGDDGVLRTRLKELAAERRRFGYRRLHLLLRREGFAVNHKKLYRITGRRGLWCASAVVANERLAAEHPSALPGGRNERWSLDFVSDALADARRFRVLALADDFTRECLALVADTSLSGARVARELDVVIADRGLPKTIVSDNGPELTALAMLRWQQETNVAWHYIAPDSRSRTRSQRASSAGCATNC
jgi:putative transposase